MKKPVQPQEYTWDLVENSEEVIVSDYPFNEEGFPEYTETAIFDDRGNSIDKAIIVKSKYRKIKNPKFDEENEIYLKAMEMYEEKNARKYQKSKGSKGLN